MKRSGEKLEAYSSFQNSRYYVHYTGQSFLQIPINKVMHVHQYHEADNTSMLSSPKISGCTPTESPSRHHSGTSDHKKYYPISCCSGNGINDIGFYWSQNYMLSKHWKFPGTEDIAVERIENDFINFCNDNKNRLTNFFDKI